MKKFLDHSLNFNQKVEQTGIRELIHSLNKASSEPVPETQLDTLFEALWPRLQATIENLPKPQTLPKQSRSQGEILEELVSSVRGVELRVRDAMDEGQAPRKRRRPRQYPFMIMDMAYSISDGPEDPVKLLFISSILKDNAPWISDIATETYRHIMAGEHFAALELQRKLVRSLEMLSRQPFSEELGIDSRELISMAKDLLPPEGIALSRQKSAPQTATNKEKPV